MRQVKIIKGHHVTEGGSLQVGRLAVDVSPMGVAYDPETGEELRVQREAQATDIFHDIIRGGIWAFNADRGECDRAGIVVA